MRAVLVMLFLAASTSAWAMSDRDFCLRYGAFESEAYNTCMRIGPRNIQPAPQVSPDTAAILQQRRSEMYMDGGLRLLEMNRRQYYFPQSQGFTCTQQGVFTTCR